jgi:hypothetical protein
MQYLKSWRRLNLYYELPSSVRMPLYSLRSLRNCRHTRTRNRLPVCPKHAMCLLSTTFIRNISHSERNTARYHKCTYIWAACKEAVTLLRF